MRKIHIPKGKNIQKAALPGHVEQHFLIFIPV